MKTYLPQVERRIINRPNQTYGVLAFDLDNAYPQRLLEMIAASPTAKSCWKKRRDFLRGQGFIDEIFGNAVINPRGLTIKKLLRAVASDKALGITFAIHIQYNANYKKQAVYYIPWEDVRIGNPDSGEDRGKFAVYYDWGRKTWKNISRGNITYLPAYNPDPAVIKQQVIDAGGWDKYKGQLYFFNPEVDDYSLAECDSVIEDIETEAGIKIFNNRCITTGFLPAAILTMKVRREDADEENPDRDGNVWQGMDGYGEPTQIEKTLGQFQGAKNGQKIMLLEYEDETAKPEILTFPVQNNDKLFEITEKSVEGRIIKGFSIPKELINGEKSSGLSNGGEKKEAIRQFNDDTREERTEISDVFMEIFTDFQVNINPSNNWEIAETPMDVTDEIIGKVAGANIFALVNSTLPRDNKISILVNAYGFKEDEAETMTPPEGFTAVVAPINTDQNAIDNTGGSTGN